MSLFELTWPKTKFKYLLLYEATEKETGLVYEDYLFRRGKEIDIKKELVIGKSWGKNFTDFHHGIGDAPYINERFIECLKAVGETHYQLIPVSVLPEEMPYFILNTLSLIDCVDREKSIFTLWTEEDERPDKLGDFHTFDKMVLDSSKVPKNVHFFRHKGWKIVTIVTNELVQEFKKRNIKGFELIPLP